MVGPAVSFLSPERRPPEAPPSSSTTPLAPTSVASAVHSDLGSLETCFYNVVGVHGDRNLLAERGKLRILAMASTKSFGSVGDGSADRVRYCALGEELAGGKFRVLAGSSLQSTNALKSKKPLKNAVENRRRTFGDADTFLSTTNPDSAAHCVYLGRDLILESADDAAKLVMGKALKWEELGEEPLKALAKAHQQVSAGLLDPFNLSDLMSDSTTSGPSSGGHVPASAAASFRHRPHQQQQWTPAVVPPSTISTSRPVKSSSRWTSRQKRSAEEAGLFFDDFSGGLSPDEDEDVQPVHAEVSTASGGTDARKEKIIDVALTVAADCEMSELVYERYVSLPMSALADLSALPDLLNRRPSLIEAGENRSQLECPPFSLDQLLRNKARMWCIPRNDGFVSERLVDLSKKSLLEECSKYHAFKVHLMVTLP